MPYEYHILYVTLRNKGFGTVAVEGLTEEQKERYAATLSMKGNKPYLFGDDIYANESSRGRLQTFRAKHCRPGLPPLSRKRKNIWVPVCLGRFQSKHQFRLQRICLLCLFQQRRPQPAPYHRPRHLQPVRPHRSLGSKAGRHYLFHWYL